jgi:hypothetical protein
MNFHYAISQA